MVRRQACFHRQRGPIHLCLCRAPRHPRSLLQFQSRQRERVQILLGPNESKMERENHLAAAHRDRTECPFAVLLLPARPWAGVYQARLRRYGSYFRRPSRNHRLAAGKFAMWHGCRQIEKASGQGLPVEDFETGDWKEGQPLSTGGGSISLIKGAPHPNAARVFINWFLSRKGQTAMQKSNDLYGEVPPNSRGIDSPKEMLPAENRLVEGRKYLDVARHEFTDMTPVLKLAKGIIKAQEQK